MELEATDACRPPTPAFLIGLTLTTVHAVLGLALGGVLLGIATGRLGELHARLIELDWSLVDFLLDWAWIVAAIHVLTFGVLLVACAMAWFGSRGGTWTVIVFSLLALPTSGLLSAPIALVTILGAMQVLDQSEPFPSDEEFYGERGAS